MPRNLNAQLVKNLQDISRNLNWGDYYDLLDKSGYCYGLVSMWGSAVLCHELQRYYKRISYLTRDYSLFPIMMQQSAPLNQLSKVIRYVLSKYHTLVEPIEQQYYEEIKRLNINPTSVSAGNLYIEKYKYQYHQAVSALKRLMPDCEYILEIRAFLDGLLLYHNPERTSLYEDSADELSNSQLDRIPESSRALFGRDLSTQNLIVSSRYIPHQRLGQLKEVYNRPAVFDAQGWDRFFFQHLFDAIKEIDQPIFILLHSGTHAAGMYLDSKTKSLHFYNPNLINGDVEINSGSLESLYQSFQPEFTKLRIQYLALNISIYTSSQTTLSRASQLSLENLSQDWRATLSEEICKNSIILYIACRDNHPDVIHELATRFPEKINPNQMNFDKSTPLYIACQNGHVHAVEALAQSFPGKIHPDQTNMNGVTPLYIACQHGHAQIVETLARNFSGSIHPMQALPDGMTPLHVACQNNHPHVVRALGRNFPHLIDPNTPDSDGWTSLAIACVYGYSEVILALFEVFRGRIRTSKPKYNELNLYQKKLGPHADQTVISLLAQL